MSDSRNLRQVFADKFTSLADKDKKLVVVVGDISHGIFSKLEAIILIGITILVFMNNQ